MPLPPMLLSGGKVHPEENLGLEQLLEEDQAIQANTLDTMDQLSVQDLAVKMSKHTMMGETKMTFGGKAEDQSFPTHIRVQDKETNKGGKQVPFAEWMSSLLGLNQDGEMQDKECQKEIYEILPNITIDTDRAGEVQTEDIVDDNINPIHTQSESDLRLIRYYNLPLPPVGKAITPPRNRSKRERLRYLSDLYQARTSSPDLKRKHKRYGCIMFKINVFFVFIILSIFMIMIFK